MRSQRHAPTLVVLAFLLAQPAAAATFFIDNTGGFDAAVAGLEFEGREDFESSTLAPNNVVAVGDPLSSGVPNGVFPNGLTAGLGLTVQSNTLGGLADVASPLGADGLATASIGYLGTPTDQVSNAVDFQSFDMIFALNDTSAVAFTPLVFNNNDEPARATFNLRVFDPSGEEILKLNNLLAQPFSIPTTRIGIVAEEGEVIGRINLFGTDYFSDADPVARYAGADDIDIYTKGASCGDTDTDGDGVFDDCDNCILDSNPILGTGGQPARESFQTTTGGQLDDDADGYGNVCDAKFGGGQVVGGTDLAEMFASFNHVRSGGDCGTSGALPCARFDLDNAGQVIGGADIVRSLQLFNQSPGPKCDECPLDCEGPACP